MWGQTRDKLLIEEQPEWAIGNAVLQLNKSAPNIVNNTAYYDPPEWTDQYPETPWLYEYLYPEDCLDPLQIKAQPYTIPVWKPRPNVHRANFMGSSRSVLTNVPNAILVYLKQVLDPGYLASGFFVQDEGSTGARVRGGTIAGTR